jgi:hypothetical protein
MYVLIMLVIRLFTTTRVQFESGARMILDAVLLSIAKISGKRDARHAVAILPGMRLSTGEGVMISHPISKFEVWLTGNVDYGIVQYEASPANKGLRIFVTSLSINPLCSEGVGRGCSAESRVDFGR